MDFALLFLISVFSMVLQVLPCVMIMTVTCLSENYPVWHVLGSPTLGVEEEAYLMLSIRIAHW